MDRRASFFLFAAALCVLLLWPCPPSLRWVGWTLAIVFVVLLGVGVAEDGLRSAMRSCMT